jgi:hypothetical protein
MHTDYHGNILRSVAAGEFPNASAWGKELVERAFDFIDCVDLID